MPGTCDPIRRNRRELVRGHAGMGNRRQFQKCLYASCGNSFHIVIQGRYVEWIVFPFRMLRRHRLHAIERECNLEIEWLLAPQCSVVIEDRDPVFGFNEVKAAGRSHAANKIKDALFRGTFVPGKKWITASHIGAPVTKVVDLLTGSDHPVAVPPEH
jgi:hypothetical protein